MAPGKNSAAGSMTAAELIRGSRRFFLGRWLRARPRTLKQYGISHFECRDFSHSSADDLARLRVA